MKQFYETYALAGEKLSPVLRELVPEAEKLFRDQYVMEFVGCQESRPENSLRKALIAQMKNFVLELGRDYIFVDEEYRLQNENHIQICIRNPKCIKGFFRPLDMGRRCCF